MPAEVDLLCEYYISSNLNNNNKKLKSNDTTPTAINNNKNNNNNNSNGFNDHGQTSKNQQQYETIEFVKYDKNPLFLLKSKYKTLNNNVNTINNDQQHTSTNSKLEITNIKSQQQEQPSISTSANASLDLTWSKIRKTGIGLWNLGNTCYLNATLQCLAYTPPLSQWLVTKPHSPHCRLKHVRGFCSLCEVERIIYDIFNSANGCVRPNVLCSNIRKISNVFDVGAQEDASEFFTTLLESMAKSIRYLSSNNNNNNIINNNSMINKSDLLNSKKNNLKANSIPTILDDIFSFQFRSRITCGNCGRLSDTIEKQNTWPIDVKYVQDIRKGMLHFLRQEVLEGANSYKCDKCNKKTRATKQYSFKTAPNILVVHLKRFDFSFAGKLSHFVQYPEILSMKTFIPESAHTNGSSSAMSAALAAMDSSSNNCKVSTDRELRNVNYKLYGVLVHLGHTSHSGHYYSYIRGPNDSWYKADDQRVSVVPSRDALSQNAYILFYNKMTNTTSNSVNQLLNASSSINVEIKQQQQQHQQNFSQMANNMFKKPNGSLNLMNKLQVEPNKISFQISNNKNRPNVISESNGHANSNTTSSISSSSLSTELSSISSLKRKLSEESSHHNSNYSYNNNNNNGIANRPKLISETNKSNSSLSTTISSSSNGTSDGDEKQQDKKNDVYGPQLPSKLFINGNDHNHESSKITIGGNVAHSNHNNKHDSEEEKSDCNRKSVLKSNKMKIKRLIKSLKSIKKINEKSVKTSKKLKRKKIKYLQSLLKDKKMIKLCKDKSSEVFKKIKKIKKLVKKSTKSKSSSNSSFTEKKKVKKLNDSPSSTLSSPANSQYEYNNNFSYFHKSSTSFPIAAVV